MFQLSRAHVRGLGPSDARLDPLTLDLRDGDGRPGHAVVWLANGGGKTTLLRLLFHVVRFGEARTIGKADSRAQAALGGALGRDDVGHVVLEWSWTGPPRSLAAGEERLLTGLVCSWRRGRAGGGTSDIVRHWYSLAAADDSLLDELIAAQVTSDRRTSHEHYVETLRRRARARPTESIVLLDGLAKWEEHLGRIGLDSELFGTQVRMNHGEGGADEMLARIRTPADLVAFLLRTITPAESLEGVDAQLDGYATKLAERPALEREATFVDELREATERLRTRHDEHQVARAAFDDERRTARQLGAAAREAAARRRTVADALGEQRAAWQEDAARNDNRRREAARRAAGLELWLARDAADAARVIVEQTAEAAAASRLEAAAWRAAPALARQQAALDRARSLRSQLDKADAATRPWRQAALRALRTLVERLDGLLAADAAALAELDRRRRDLQRDAGVQEQRRGEIDTTLETALARLATVGTMLQAVETELAAAREDGVLDAAEEPAIARGRHAATAEAAERRRADAAQRRLAAREASNEAAHIAAAAQREIDRMTAERERRAAERAELDCERDQLSRDEAVLEALEATAVDLDLAGNDAVAALRAAADRRQRALTALTAAGTADERRLEHVAATGLLPASDDLAAVVGALRELGHDVATGAEHLERALGEADRRRRLEHDPGFADAAVLVGDLPFDAAGVAAPLRAVPLRRAGEELELPAVSGHPGTWDRAAAAEWASAAEARADDRRRRAEDLRDRSSETRDVAERLQRHLGRWGVEPRRAALVAIADLGRAIDGRTAARNAAEEQSEQSRRDEQHALDAEQQARELHSQAALAQRAAERLVGRVAPAEQLRRERDALGTTVDRLRTDRLGAAEQAHAARAQDAALEAQAAVVRTRRDRRSALRDQYGPRLDVKDEADVTATSGERPADDAPAADVDVLIERVEAADREVLRHSPPDEVRRALEEAERAAVDAGRELPADQGTRARAAELLRDPAGADRDARRHAAAEADARADAEAVAARLAHRTLADADAEVDRLARVPDVVAPDPPPDDAAAGSAALEAARREQEVATAGARDAETRLRETAEDFHRHDRIATRLADAAEALPDPEPDDPPPAAELVDSLGDVSAVHARRVEAQLALDAAQAEIDTAASRREDAARSVQDVLVDARHDGVADPIRRQLRGAGAAALVERAAALVDELARRAEMIADRLATLEQDRQVVAATLAREVDGAVRAVRRIQRRSTLPEGLGAWTGRQMVTFGGLELPKEPAAVRALVGGVIERLVTADQRPRGVDLLVQAVLDALDLTRLTAKILKPTSGEPGDPQPVDQLPTFSGGQRATVAILLYATFARVRREGLQQRGRDAGVGTLFLDNPLGKANAQFLVDRQLAVARAAGIQLVYTTGIGDFEALDRFPVVIRLRNRGVVGRAIRRVLPEERAHAIAGDGGGGLEGVHQRRRSVG